MCLDLTDQGKDKDAMSGGKDQSSSDVDGFIFSTLL